MSTALPEIQLLNNISTLLNRNSLIVPVAWVRSPYMYSDG